MNDDKLAAARKLQWEAFDLIKQSSRIIEDLEGKDSWNYRAVSDAANALWKSARGDDPG